MISVFDLFKIGIGPSSSHTVGPMKAAKAFIQNLSNQETIDQIKRIKIELFGSLAATGVGHATDSGILLGLLGETPDQIDPYSIKAKVQAVRDSGRLLLNDQHRIQWNESEDLLYHADVFLPEHSNAMTFMAFDQHGFCLASETYFSIGGGFIQRKGEVLEDSSRSEPPYVFSTAQALLKLAKEHQLSIADIVRSNELFWHGQAQLHQGIDQLWLAMKACVEKGLETRGILPGGLNIQRRAADVLTHLNIDAPHEKSLDRFLNSMDAVNAYALAVNEENAAGGRVVTAPTNGAAGIFPAVLYFAWKSFDDFSKASIEDFFLAATAFGGLFKMNASISGAEVGCQGEVGAACAMAAAGLAQIMGATPAQVENAAEIATEHNLGLTCDPVAGLVQVPCIERNAIAAVKAINAARMAIRGNGQHFISFDKVVRTVRETGADMQSKYKETSQGGLAVNITEC